MIAPFVSIISLKLKEIKEQVRRTFSNNVLTGRQAWKWIFNQIESKITCFYKNFRYRGSSVVYTDNNWKYHYWKMFPSVSSLFLKKIPQKRIFLHERNASLKDIFCYKTSRTCHFQLDQYPAQFQHYSFSIIRRTFSRKLTKREKKRNRENISRRRFYMFLRYRT